MGWRNAGFASFHYPVQFLVCLLKCSQSAVLCLQFQKAYSMVDTSCQVYISVCLHFYISLSISFYFLSFYISIYLFYDTNLYFYLPVLFLPLSLCLYLSALPIYPFHILLFSFSWSHVLKGRCTDKLRCRELTLLGGNSALWCPT